MRALGLTINSILGFFALGLTVAAPAGEAQLWRHKKTTQLTPPSANSTGWTSPLEADLHPDSPPVGDYVPCLFDANDSGQFRGVKSPSLEQNTQTAARKAIEASSLLTPTQQNQLKLNIAGIALSALPLKQAYDAVQKSATNAGIGADAADSIANQVAIAASQTGPKRPGDVSCGMTVLPWTIARWAFGREIAENFIVVQVTVRNLNDSEQFLVHDVELTVDTQPGMFNRFSSSVDQTTVDGVALTAEEGWNSRDFWLRFANFVGTIISAASVPVGGPSFKDAAGIYTGAFVPGLSKFTKDHTSEQIARLDSSIFTNSQSRRVIVAKNDSATFDTFLPVQSLRQIDWDTIYLYKTKAAPIRENATFLRKNAKDYKDWSPLALLALNNSTFVIVSGAHIVENPSQAQIASLLCPPNNSNSIDLASLAGDTLACTMKGTNLGVLSQVILENAQDTNDHVYAVGTPAVSGADPTQAAVSFKVKDLQQLKGTSYKVFYAVKGGTPQASDVKVTVQQAVAFNPSSLVFASQAVDTISPIQPSALTNRGTTALNITGITVAGANSDDFKQTNTCGTAVSAGTSCTISVTFKPTGTGSRTASISIADSGPGSPHTIELSGTAVAAPAPALTLSPESVAFGSQTTGSVSQATVVTLTNSGSASLSITGIAIAGANVAEFGETNTCGSAVAAGGNCTISVTFRPTSSGAKSAFVSITDNASGNPHTISLSGTGVAPAAAAVDLNPSAIAFGSQSTGSSAAAQAVTLKNSGNAALSITGIAIAGTNTAEFAETHSCGGSVAAGGSCTISVTFRPTSASAKNASLNVTDNAPGSPHMVALSGTGVALAVVSASPATVAFGSQASNSASTARTITLKNTGNGQLSITAINVGGANAAEFMQTNTCGTTLASGMSCNIAVTFQPRSSGTKSATINISDNASDSPQAITLTGSAP